MESKKENAVLIVGDVHGSARAWERICLYAAKAGHTELYQLGDIAIYFHGIHHLDKFTQVAMKILERYELRCTFLDGNHDRLEALSELPLDDEGFGRVNNNLRYSPRGHRWTVAGKTWASLGGAVSIDQGWRTEGKDWWPEESTTTADVSRLGNEKVDVLLTHEAPAGITGLVSSMIDPIPEVIAWDAWQNRLRIAEAAANTTPEILLAGHWHQRLSTSLSTPAGTIARVEVLHRETFPGSVVELNTEDLSVKEFYIKPL